MGSGIDKNLAPLCSAIGMLETGDPLAGTERNEVSAKNSGMMESWVLARWENGLSVKSLLTARSNMIINA
jgi:hypothetical protein